MKGRVAFSLWSLGGAVLLASLFVVSLARTSSAQSASAVVNFTGAASDGVTNYGGPPYCYYQRTFSGTAISMAVDTSTGLILSGQISSYEVESALYNCPYPPLPPEAAVYALTSGNITGGNVSANFSGTNTGETAAFTGTIAGGSITGTLTFSRGGLEGTDLYYTLAVPAELSGVVVPELATIWNAIDQLYQTIGSNPANAGLTKHQIAELAFTAIVDARNGFYGTGNEFAFLKNLDTAALGALDHFSQAYDVSTNNTLLENVGTGFILGAIIDPVYNIGKAISQAFGVAFLPTGNAPQSPANFDFWALAGAKAAISEMPPGAAPDAGTDAVPIDPVSTAPNSSVFVVPQVTTNPVTLDPARARNYHFQVLYGPPVSSVMIPSSAVTPGHLKLNYGGSTVPLSPGVVYAFPAPVSEFTLLNVNGPAKAPFLARLGFADDGLEVVAQTAVSGITANLASCFNSVALDSTGANDVVSFTVTNTGSDTAKLVKVTGIKANGIPTSTTLPIAVGTLISGATMNINASFPAGSISSGDHAQAEVTLSYAGGTVSSGFRIVTPSEPSTSTSPCGCDVSGLNAPDGADTLRP